MRRAAILLTVAGAAMAATMPPARRPSICLPASRAYGT